MSGDPSLADLVDGLAEGRRGALVQSKKERSVWQAGVGGAAYFAKRGVGGKRREVRREAKTARELAGAGLGPRVLASGVHGGAEWVVTADAGPALLDVLAVAGPADRRSLLVRAAAFLRELHDGGWSVPDIDEEHLRVGRDRMLLIDAARASASRRPLRIAVRAREVAALLFSLGWPWIGDLRRRLTRAERVRLVRGASGLAAGDLRDFSRSVDARIRALRTRTRWRHGAWAASRELLAALGGAAGERAAERLLDAPGSVLVRRLPDRENSRIFGPDGSPRWFVKRFPPRAAVSPAVAEIEACELFRRAGVPVHVVDGFADDVERGSVICVRACPGEPLDDLLRRGTTPAERRALAAATARILRRMRDAGLRHRDAYPCHVFASRAGPASFELRIIDLTRAGAAPWPRERWFVKDAAQLWHGSREAGATATDAVRWLRAYFGEARLSGPSKRFARRVAAKERSIRERQQRKARRRTAEVVKT